VLGYCAYAAVFALGYLAVVVRTGLQTHQDWIVQLSEWRLDGMLIGGFFLALVLVEQGLRERDKQTQINKLQSAAKESQIATQLFEERRALIDMLTHELKNPLGTMTFAISTLRHKLISNHHVLQQVNNMDDCIQRMDNLIEHVAVTNKFDGSYIAKPAVQVDAQILLEGMVSEFADPDRFSLNIEDQACFKADPQLLSVMLENLIQNAFKYGLVNEKVDISVQRKANGLEFEISNPVASDRMPDPQHLFDRYYRHKNVQDQPGMGIGLSLVQTVTQKMNATVAYRADGERAVFTVRFNP
jgi:signal transduction histidine kinase